MPTYDYECPSCGSNFELFQQMTDKPLNKCPKCSSKKVKRLIGSGSGIIFKGTGFYETDYKRKETKPLSGEESKKEAKTEGKAEQKKETKTETKAETSSKPAEKDKK